MFFGPLTSPHWEPVRQWSASEHGVSAPVAGVLTVAGSLTRFLERHHQIHLDVQLHEQIVDKATPEEAELLNCATGSPALRRNVSLLHRGTVMFDAESVLPLDVLPTTLMAELEAGQRPLANLLSDRGLSLSRTDLSIAHIQGPSIYEHLWARRSVLRSESGATALVTEVFHETFWRKLHYLCQSM